MIKKSLVCHGSVLALAALVSTVALSACSSGQDTRSPSVKTDEHSGQIGMDLTIGGGVTLASVHYKVTGNGITPIEGDIPVDASGATASLLLRLPAGTGYSVSFTATDVTGKTSCTGTASFDVTAGATNGVTVPLVCGTVTTRGNERFDSTFNTCPEITQLAVAPLAIDAPGKINVSAGATDVDGNTLTYAWTATGGSFDAPTAQVTKYNCSAAGPQTLTISVSDGQGCVSAVTADVLCTSAAVCGDGVVGAGEACEPPAGSVAQGSATCQGTNDPHPCQLRVASCGDGFVETGETCDPPAAGTCDTTCHSIICGDGIVSPGEGCEPPNTATCGLNCQPRPVVCGDGFIEPPETCDPPTADGTCNAQCQGVPPCTACTGANCSLLATGCTNVAGCSTVLACIESTDCAKNSTRNGAECYCGAAVDDDTCFSPDPTAPQGACKAVFDAAVPGGPLAVGAAFFDTSKSVGAAIQETVCRLNNCSAQCF
ncbi:MAG TPA: hypothetical protein VGI10_04185 [Polyangiaceae bacterium]